MRAYRIAWIAAGLVWATDAGAEQARAPEPLVATLQCDRAVEPGRVRCTAEARAASGHTLQWADVVLIELPDFTQALKGRLAVADSIARDTTSERWAFGLVAKKTGEGPITVRLRAVVCEDERCTALTVDAKTTIRVG